MFKAKSQSKLKYDIRKWLLVATACTWCITTGGNVNAESSAVKPPEMLFYKDLDAKHESVFEHGENRISYAALQDDQVIIKTIGAYGQIKTDIAFPRRKLESISEFHHTQDKGYIAGGGTQILKVNGKGEKQWEYTLQLEGGYITSVNQLKDGSYAVVVDKPSSQSNAHVLHWIQFSSTGEVVHEDDLQGVVFDRIHSILITSDGGFVVSGVSCQNEESEHVFLAKFDSSGHVEWQQSLSPAEDSQSVGVMSTAEGIDGSVVAAGYYNHPNPNDSRRYLTTGFVLSVDRSGSQKWIRVLDSAFDRSMLNDIQPTSDGGFIATGKVNEDWHGTVARQLVWGIRENGDSDWTKIINRGNYNSGDVVQPLQNGEALLIGTTDGSYKLIKLGTVRRN